MNHTGAHGDGLTAHGCGQGGADFTSLLGVSVDSALRAPGQLTQKGQLGATPLA